MPGITTVPSTILELSNCWGETFAEIFFFAQVRGRIHLCKQRTRKKTSQYKQIYFFTTQIAGVIAD